MKNLRKAINQELKANGLLRGKSRRTEQQGTHKNQFGTYKVIFQQETDGFKIEKTDGGFYIHPISKDWKNRVEILDFIFETLKEKFNVNKNDCSVKVIA